MAEKDEELGASTGTDALPPEVQVDAGTEQPKPAELTPEEGVADLKAKLEAATRQAAEAQQREAQARQFAAQAQQMAGASQLDMINGSIAQAEQNLQILKARYAQAQEAGDHAAASEAMTATAAWTGRLQQLQGGKSALEQQLRQPPVQPIQQNPVEALAATLTPASAQWLRQHPAAIQNMEALRGAHAVAVSKFAHESPEYFRAIESYLGLTGVPADQGRPQAQPQNRAEPVGDDAMSAAAQPVSQRQSAPAAAPVTRTGNGGATPRGTVRLTADEVEAAEMSGMTPNEYYEAKTDPERYKARLRQKANGRAAAH